MCVCVCERERERESLCVCVRKRERERECVCVCARARACVRAYVLDGERCKLFTSRTPVVVQTAVYLTSYSDWLSDRFP